VAIKELLDQIRARGDRAILYDPSAWLFLTSRKDHTPS
jgi:hypothetical protein